MPTTPRANRMRRSDFAGVIVAAFTAAVGLLLLIEPFGARMTLASYDIPFLWRHSLPTDDVRIVYLDDISHRELKQPLGAPWDRSLNAQLIQQLTTDGARLIVFDIIFGGPSANPAADEALAQAMKKSGRVVIGGCFHADQPKWEEPPGEPFASAAAAWGNVNFIVDSDGAVRRFFIDVDNIANATNILWLPRRAAQLAGAPTPPSDSIGGWLNFAGPPGAFQSTSFYRALQPDGVPPGFFKDKIVFIGAQSAAGFSGDAKDAFRTPYSSWHYLAAPGVDFHATATLNLLRHNWLTQMSPGAEIALAVILALAAGLGLMRLPPFWATGAAVGGALLVAITACFMEWRSHLWFPWLILIVEIGLALFCAIIWNSLQLYIEKRLVQESLAAHLSPAIARQLVKDPALRRVGGVKQEVSIIFTDIANFSRVSEMMHPDDLVALLNRYFEAALHCIHRTDGTVVDLIGDAIFAIWNAPVEQPDHRERACRAAIDLHRQLVEFDSQNRHLLLRTRVGLHTGVACVGNIGSSIRFDYTAIGESINLASRLEGLNKHLGANVLASREIQRAVENEMATRLVGHFKFKGFGRAVEIHELLGGRDEVESTRPWRETFADALQDFRGHKFDSAAAKFTAVHAMRQTAQPETATHAFAADGPSRFYLEKIEEFKVHPPPSDWVGEVELKEK